MTTYIQGETISFSANDASYASVSLRYGSNSVTMTKTGSVWSASVGTDDLSGQFNFMILADGKAIESGSFFVRPLVSHWRDVVNAIDEALQGNAANGKYSVTVGEITMQDKTFEEMVKAREFYEKQAQSEEAGIPARLGPHRVAEVYL